MHKVSKGCRTCNGALLTAYWAACSAVPTLRCTASSPSWYTPRARFIVGVALRCILGGISGLGWLKEGLHTGRKLRPCFETGAGEDGSMRSAMAELELLNVLVLMRLGVTSECSAANCSC